MAIYTYQDPYMAIGSYGRVQGPMTVYWVLPVL